MPARSACSTAAALRIAYRYLQGGAAISGVAALLLLPLLYTLALPAWQTAGLLLLALCYVARKAYQHVRTGRAGRQLRLEEHFLQQPPEAHQLVRCLQHRRHLWAQSCTVQVLRKLLARPLSHLLLTSRKKTKLRQHYRRTLAPVQPAPFSFDLFLSMALLGLASAAVLHSRASLSGPWFVQAGLLGAPLLLMAELFQTACRRRARRAFRRLTRALTTWTLAYGIDEALRPERRRRSSVYRHTLLYRAPSWFGPAPDAPPREAA